MAKVLVVVPKRDPHPGFWCCQRFFPVGKTQFDATEEQLKELKADEARGFITVIEPSEVLEMATEPASRGKK